MRSDNQHDYSMHAQAIIGAHISWIYWWFIRSDALKSALNFEPKLKLERIIIIFRNSFLWIANFVRKVSLSQFFAMAAVSALRPPPSAILLCLFHNSSSPFQSFEVLRRNWAENARLRSITLSFGAATKTRVLKRERNCRNSSQKMCMCR